MDVDGFWDRRVRFLEGVELVGVHLEWVPFTYIKTYDNGTEYAYGIILDSMRLLQVSLIIQIQ